MMPPQSRGLMAGMTEEDEAQIASAPDDRIGEQNADTPTVDGEEDEPNVSPEEQAAYDGFVTAGFDIIYEGGRVQPGIVKLLDDDPADLIAVLGDQVPELKERFNPVIALAATTVIVVTEVIRRMPEKPAGEIVMHGGKALLEDLAEIAEAVGRTEFTSDEMNQAFLHAVDLYQAVRTAEGAIDKEMASQEFADLLNAQEQGRLGEVLPQLAGVGERGDG